MAKAKKKREMRTYDKPDIGFKYEMGRTQVKVFILSADDSLPTNTSTEYNHTFRGPGIVIERFSNGSREVREHDLNDPNVWKWISRLVRDGLTGLKGLEMLSEIDNPMSY